MEILPPAFTRERVAIQARVSGHPGRRRRNGRLFFEFPAELHPWSVIQGGPDDCHDAFARALVMSAMEARRDLAIHGRLSRSLLDNLARYQAIVGAGLPKYRPAEVLADEVIPCPAAPRAAGDEAIIGFSGGLDSVYTLYTHQKGIAAIGSRKIPNCLFVHGFDIPLDDAAYERAFESARRIAHALSSRLFPMRTNLKAMVPVWPHSFGSALAAVLSLFERRYAAGLIASSYEDDNPYTLESGTSSNRHADPLLSSHSFTILHDLGNNRAEKSAILRDFEIGRRNLRVCWEGDDLAANCGVCSKCVLQMLAMKMAGVDDLSAFRSPLTPESVRGVNLYSRAFLWQWRGLIRYAAGRGWADRDLLDAMQQRADECEGMLDAGQTPPSGSRTRPPRKRRGVVRWAKRLLSRARRRRDDAWP